MATPSPASCFRCFGWGVLGSVLAIVFGHVALDRRHDWRGGGHRRMALAGLILGYAGAAVTVVFIATGSFYITTADKSQRCCRIPGPYETRGADDD